MSQQRRCDFTKAVDQQWYMTLGDFEHAYEDHDSTVYGPFPTHERAEQYRQDNFRNPGGSVIDASGTAPVPPHPTRPVLGEDEEDDLLAAFRASPRGRQPGV